MTWPPFDVPALTMMSPNCVGIGEAALDVDRVLEVLAAGAGGVPTWPAGDLLALLLDRLDHVLRGQPAR